MIDWNESAKLNNMSIDKLKVWFKKYPNSGKRIAAICDDCGKRRDLQFRSYSSLCIPCSRATEHSRSIVTENYNINENATFDQFGYKSTDLTSMSNKKIIAVCVQCGKERQLSKCDYNDLCQSCSGKRENLSDITLKKLSDVMLGNKYGVGRKDTPELIEKKRLRMLGNTITLGYKHTSEAIAKIRAAVTGREVTEETKQLLRELNTGNKNPMFGRGGEEHYNYGKHLNETTRILMSAIKQGISVEEWTDFTNKNRDHLIPTNECLQINNRFLGSHAHHLTSSIIIYIPRELHRHISHNMKTGRNMDIINKLAIQYLVGEI